MNLFLLSDNDHESKLAVWKRTPTLVSECELLTFDRRTNMLKSMFLITALGIAALSASSLALAKSAKIEHPALVEAVVAAGAEQLVMTVKSINSASRTIVLETPDGKLIETLIKPDISNIQNVNPGDKIVVDYVALMAVKVEKVSPSLMGTLKTGEKTVNAETAGLPGETYDSVIEAIGRVQKVDTHARSVTVDVGGGGRMRTVKAGKEVDLSTIKVGDTVKAILVEHFSISVDSESSKLKPMTE